MYGEIQKLKFYHKIRGRGQTIPIQLSGGQRRESIAVFVCCVVGTTGGCVDDGANPAGTCVCVGDSSGVTSFEQRRCVQVIHPATC